MFCLIYAHFLTSQWHLGLEVKMKQLVILEAMGITYSMKVEIFKNLHKNIGAKVLCLSLNSLKDRMWVDEVYLEGDIRKQEGRRQTETEKEEMPS